MSTIRFETTPLKIGDWTILRLPKSASAKLPSRGMTLIEGTINGFRSKIVLEPDGKGSHWFRVDSGLCEAASIETGNTVTMAFEPTKEWPEPDVPADLNRALTADPQANALWTEYHSDGAVGLAPLDTLNQQPGNAQPAHRGSIVEAQGRRTKAMLLQS